MALKQTKILKNKITKEEMTKTKLAKKLRTSVAKINEYILGDDETPMNIKIIPLKNGIVNVEFTEEIEVAKYEGVFFNKLKNGDTTYYITYKDLGTNKKITLNMGKRSEGITEKYCSNERRKILQEMRLDEVLIKTKNKRIEKEILSFDMMAKKYYENRKLHMTKTNYTDALAIYTNHIEPYIGNMPVEEIKTSHIEKIMQIKKAKYANSTINFIVEKISSIFNFGIKKGIYTGLNPTKEIQKLKSSNERTRFLSKEEIELLLSEVKENEILYLFTILSLTTGGRLKTICNIKVKDIKLEDMFIDLQDFKNKTLYIAFIKNDTYFLSLLKKHMKGKNANDFLFGRRTLIANVKYIERQMPKIFKKLFNQDIDDKNEELSAEQLAEIRREKVVIHTLRHTFASQLVINGTPIFTVKKLMNHKDINHTMRYTKLSPESGRDFVNDIF